MEISVGKQMGKQLLVIFWVFFYFQVPQNVAAESKMDQVFKDNEIVPDVLQEAPKNLLKVLYENGIKVDKGNELTPTQVKSQPKVEWDAKNDEYYTLIMTDPDAPSRAQPTVREFKHWLVVNIPGNNLERGEVIAEYVGSGPPKDTGLHRYIFLLYKQPGKINVDESHVAQNSRRNRMNFKAAKFAEKYNMGCPVAGNFYQAQYDDYVPFVHQQLANEN